MRESELKGETIQFPLNEKSKQVAIPTNSRIINEFKPETDLEKVTMIFIIL